MRFSLLTDGSSDTVLIPILSWMLGQQTSEPFESQWADLRGLARPPRTLSERIATAVDLYPCDLLFVHRDAEREPRDSRVKEIRRALSGILHPPVVCVVPVRMQEAWLLFDELALRRAAGCPNGKMRLDLVPLHRVEQEPDPKDVLHGLLRAASGLTGRRAKQFRPQVQTHRLAELIDDFSPLRQLPAFQALEVEVVAAVKTLRCSPPAA